MIDEGHEVQQDFQIAQNKPGKSQFSNVASVENLGDAGVKIEKTDYKDANSLYPGINTSDTNVYKTRPDGLVEVWGSPINVSTDSALGDLAAQVGEKIVQEATQGSPNKPGKSRFPDTQTSQPIPPSTPGQPGIPGTPTGK